MWKSSTDFVMLQSVRVCVCVRVYVCVCVLKIHPQEPSQLEGSLYNLIETDIVELAPWLMSVYKLISQSRGDS